VALIEEGQGDRSVPRELDPRAAGRRLAAVADGLGSMQYLGLAERRHARRLLRDSLELELGLR
jgi:hypothetical protein